MRLKMLENEEVKQLLSKHLNINYESLKSTDTDWIEFKTQITFNATNNEIQPGHYLRVPFKEALTLVGKR